MKTRSRKLWAGAFVIVAISLAVFFSLKEPHPTDLPGIEQIQPGMSPQEVMRTLGVPDRKRAMLMTNNIYGVPGEMKARIGTENYFSLWEYEFSIPGKSVNHKVWFIPKAPQETNHLVVLDVTQTTVLYSLQYRLTQPVWKKLNRRWPEYFD